MSIYNLDSQAFTPSAPYMDCLEFAALYTLQDRLARYAESHGCFEHRQKPRRCFFEEASTQLIGDADTPRGTRRKLFAGDEAVVEPAMNSRWGYTEDLGSLVHGGQFSGRSFSRWLEARDVAITAQTTDLIGGEAFTVGRLATLTIENAGDDIVGVVGGQTSH